MNRKLPQIVTYWPTTPTGFGGFSFSAPQILNGRWEDKVEVTVDSAGQTMTSLVNVYVDKDVEINGYLFLGTSVLADPSTLEGAYKIRRFDKTPDLRGLNFLRKAVL